MARSVRVTVLTPAESLLEIDGVEWVHIRLANGTGLSVYPGHAPLIAETVTAPLRYADESGEHVFDVEAGILQVKENEVMIFTSGRTETAEMPKPSAIAETKRFERLARELRARLERESESELGRVLNGPYDET